MNITPVTKTTATANASSPVSYKEPTPGISPIWGKDEYVPGAESPYPSYPVAESKPQCKDEQFADIARKYGGGINNGLPQMYHDFLNAGVITWEEFTDITFVLMCRAEEERNRLGAQDMDFRVFMQTFRLSIDDVLMALIDRIEFDTKVGSSDERRSFLRDFFAKLSAIERGDDIVQEGTTLY